MAGDLNLKKSWNPALVKNQQKVWELEQKKLQELKESKEKNLEFKKEQEYLDLLKLQYGDNFSKDQLSSNEKLKVSKLSWMYEDVPFEKQETETMSSSGFIETTTEFTEGKTEAENLLSGNRAFKKHDTNGFANERMNKVIGTGLQKPNSTNYGDDPLAMIQKQQVGQQRLKQRDTVREKTTNRRDDGSWSRLSHGEDRDNHKPRYHPHSLNSSRGHKHHHSRERHNRHSSSDGRRPHRPREEERSREDSFSLRQRDPRDSHSKRERSPTR